MMLRPVKFITKFTAVKKSSILGSSDLPHIEEIMGDFKLIVNPKFIWFYLKFYLDSHIFHVLVLPN